MGLLETSVPGTSAAARRLREELLDFSSTLSAKAVTLRGPVGVGKSTVARLIGFLKRIAPLKLEEASRIIGDVRYDATHRVDVRVMPWYVELALTGLVETLAETQLFGVAKGAFTGAHKDRAGIFERPGKADGAAATGGGVVFLDEIGELNHALQAKLLPVLSGQVFYRIGGEGNGDHELEFHGITISASWKALDTGILRPDLLSRVAPYVIDVPGISEREEDFPQLVQQLQRAILASFGSMVEEICERDPKADRAYLRGRITSIAPIADPTIAKLSRIDWSRHGNLRGLNNALEQILIGGRDVDAVIDGLVFVVEARSIPDVESIIPRILARAADGGGLAAHVKAIESEQRQRLSEILLSDTSVRRTLARTLQIDETKLKTQARQLARRRLRESSLEGEE